MEPSVRKTTGVRPFDVSRHPVAVGGTTQGFPRVNEWNRDSEQSFPAFSSESGIRIERKRGKEKDTHVPTALKDEHGPSRLVDREKNHGRLGSEGFGGQSRWRNVLVTPIGPG